MIGQSGNHGREQHADGNTRLPECLDGGESGRGRRCARLHDLAEFGVERGERDENSGRVMTRQFAQQVNIPRDQLVLGDEADRVAEFGQDFETTARDFQTPFDGLVRIGHAAHRQDLRPPAGRGKFLPQQRGRIFLHHDLRFKIESGGKAEVLMGRPGVTINAAMFAAAIRIDAGAEADIGTVVPGNDGPGIISVELGGRRRDLLLRNAS